MTYKCAKNLDDIKEYLKPVIEGRYKEIAFDFETSPRCEYRKSPSAALDPHRAEITGISISLEAASAIYIPLRHKIGKNLNNSEVMTFLTEEVFHNKELLKVAHNLMFETMFLIADGTLICKPVYDTMAASQLMMKNPYEFRSLKESGLKTLVREFFDVELPSFETTTQGSFFDELDPDDLKTNHYACADADYALRLYHFMSSWFMNYLPAHHTLCLEIESPVSIYVGLMKYSGIMTDTLMMYQKQLESEKKLAHLQEEINRHANREIALGKNAATNALKKYLYEELKLPVLKTTSKYKWAADDEALILLKEHCIHVRPELAFLIELIQEYRKWSKLKSTYIDGALKFVSNTTGAIHPDFFALGTETGRFASRNPNAQNWPRKDNDLVGVRNFFEARDGHVLLDFDFSQIELRVGAYYCRDEIMMNTYRNSGDIHAQTTSVIYGVPFEEAADKTNEHFKERRSIAKNCNFGVFYGLFPSGLKKNLQFKAGLHISISECEDIIKNLKSGYPGLAIWQEEEKHQARLREYSQTAFGRRRYLRDINSKDWHNRTYSERCALNTPIQGTAADILKVAMVRILDGLNERLYIKPLLTIHDELVFEVPEDKVKEAANYIKACMETVPFEGFDVPIIVEGAIGKRFGELEELI